MTCCLTALRQTPDGVGCAVMKNLKLHLTNDQFHRIDVLANMLQSTPEHVMIGLALGDLDSFADGWDEFQHVLHRAIEFYGERRKASSQPRGDRFEDGAPDRMLRLAGA
jgi:hypothetical protein